MKNPMHVVMTYASIMATILFSSILHELNTLGLIIVDCCLNVLLV
jgi:hypothetical protein